MAVVISVIEAARAGDEQMFRTAVHGVVEAQRARTKNSAVAVLSNQSMEWLNLHDSTGRSAIHYLAAGGHADVLEALLEFGADVNCPDKDGATALHYAAEGNHEAVVEVLFLFKCDLDVKDKGGLTPIHRAAGTGNALVLSMLISEGADLSAETEKGWTALHVAAFYGNSDIASIILQRPTNLNSAVNAGGWTALHSAAMGGSPEVTRLLLHHGARPDFPSQNGKTALQIAARENNKEAFRELLLAGASAEVPEVQDVAWMDAGEKPEPDFDAAEAIVVSAPPQPVQQNHHTSLWLRLPGKRSVDEIFCFFERVPGGLTEQQIPLTAACAAYDFLETGVDNNMLLGCTCLMQLTCKVENSGNSESSDSTEIKVKFLPAETGQYRMHVRTSVGHKDLAGFPLTIIVCSIKAEAQRNAERVRALGLDNSRETLSQRLDVLESEFFCWSCEANRREIVMLPCNHFSLCYDCSMRVHKKSGAKKLLRKCNVCDQKTTGYVRVEHDESSDEESGTEGTPTRLTPTMPLSPDLPQKGKIPSLKLGKPRMGGTSTSADYADGSFEASFRPMSPRTNS